jgi:mRNA-degrading endonuclease YafQ of YafQ-DinJ toxin-antitoxin module
VPQQVLKRYEKWKDIVHLTGPAGLRLIRGFNDGPLRGEWNGHRSSRLGEQYRVIYRIENDRVSLGVERAKTLARALKCHPAVLLFPGWNVEVESAA